MSLFTFIIIYDNEMDVVSFSKCKGKKKKGKGSKEKEEKNAELLKSVNRQKKGSKNVWFVKELLYLCTR